MRAGWMMAGSLAAALAGTAREAASRPVVIELFTSEGCSSCPPADALLTELARSRADVLPLAFHVTYWDYLGWRDPFSFDAATRRQRVYAAGRGDRGVFTPELVVEGARSVVGSEAGEVASAIREARGGLASAARVDIRRVGNGARIEVAPGSGRAEVLLVGFDPEHRSAVARGENAGRTLVETNVVRSVRSIGTWTGAPLVVDVAGFEGEDAAVLLQAADGRVLGAGRLPDAGRS